MTKSYSDVRSSIAEVYSPGSKPAESFDPSSTNSKLLIDTDELSRLTGLSPQTYAQGRSNGLIPLNYVKLGRRVFYRWEDVQRFINDHIVVCGGAE